MPVGGRECAAAALAPDVVVISDGGGVAQAPLQPVYGDQKAARLLMGIAGRVPPGTVFSLECFNGQLGIVARLHGRTVSAMAVTVAGETVQTLHLIANPAKLTTLDAGHAVHFADDRPQRVTMGAAHSSGCAVGLEAKAGRIHVQRVPGQNLGWLQPPHAFQVGGSRLGIAVLGGGRRGKPLRIRLRRRRPFGGAFHDDRRLPIFQMQRCAAIAAQVLNVYGRRIAAEVAAAVEPDAVEGHRVGSRRGVRWRASNATSRPTAVRPLSSRGTGWVSRSCWAASTAPQRAT